MAVLTVVAPGEEWVNAVSAALVDAMHTTPRGRFCLATGATPAPAYHRLASLQLDLSMITLAMLDEFGGLDADDPGRCLAKLERDLLGRMHADHRPMLEPIEMNEPPNANWPGPIRLAVLGIGTNGHIAMNEPGSSSDSGTRRVELAESTSNGARRYGARRAPTWGVTIGLGPLLRSEELWVLATGASKAAIVAAAIDGPTTPEIPASLLQGHANVRWFVDSEAATQVLG